MDRPTVFAFFFLVAFAALGRAEESNRGLVVVTEVAGDVVMIARQTRMPLQKGEMVSQGATVLTGKDSHVKFLLSNGASLHLAEQSEVGMQEFFQDLPGGVLPEARSEEPSVSRVKWVLIRGEVMGRVPRLHHDRGSRFAIATRGGEFTVRDESKPLSTGTNGKPLSEATRAAFRSSGYALGVDDGTIFRVHYTPVSPRLAEVRLTDAAGYLDFLVVKAGGVAFEMSPEREMDITLNLN